MRLKNVATYAVIVTCICLGYVKQQVEVVKLSYSLRDKEKKVSELVDRNRLLLYNNMSLKSPQYLAEMLKQNDMGLGLPDTDAVAKVRIVRKHPAPLVKNQVAVGWKTNFVDTVVPKAQAAVTVRR